MTREEIGKILKNLRVNSGMTQNAVAKLIGRKQQIIGHWETGYSQPDADTLFTLCEIYGVTVDEAFGFTKMNKTELEEKYIKIANMLQSENVSAEEFEKIYQLYKDFSRKADEIIRSEQYGANRKEV